jgi:hypothetical protein
VQDSVSIFLEIAEYEDSNNLYTQFASWRSGMDPAIIQKAWEGSNIDETVFRRLIPEIPAEQVAKIKSNLSFMTDNERNIIINKYVQVVVINIQST